MSVSFIMLNHAKKRGSLAKFSGESRGLRKISPRKSCYFINKIYFVGVSP